jgi:hypothetical protein
MSEQEVLPPEAEEARMLPAVRQSEAMITKGEVTVAEVVAGHAKIVEVMQAVMKEDIHYGKIPGVGKPTLLKPGAEVLLVTLRLSTEYVHEIHRDGMHREVVSSCTLRHIPTGLVIATGSGLCTTYESNYGQRQGKRRCLTCGAEAIVKSTKKNTFFCISNEGGCGARWPFDSEGGRELEAQDVGKVENPDLADTWNTVLKMADKRALVAAVLNGTAASDVFTQDAEDLSAPAASGSPEGQASQTAQQTQERAPVGLGTWKGIEESVRRYGDIVWEAWVEFVKQANDYLLETDGEENRTKLRGLTGHAAAYLMEHYSPDAMPPVDRLSLVSAWRHAIPATVLEGPAWAMDASETDAWTAERPTKEGT